MYRDILFGCFHKKKKTSGTFVSQWLWHIPFVSNGLALFYHVGYPELQRVNAETTSVFFLFTSKWWDQLSIRSQSNVTLNQQQSTTKHLFCEHHNGRPKCALNMLNGILKRYLVKMSNVCWIKAHCVPWHAAIIRFVACFFMKDTPHVLREHQQ